MIATNAHVMKYRADIDGLRAVAVLLVLFYHAGVPGFGAGFVGVDIFFVISGYLICGMIDSELLAGTFLLGRFYRRRILRILPALFAMFLVTSALAYLFLLPVELTDYAKSLASAVGSISNFYFAQTAGYFDAPAETKPLLHTWSLSVEEQFYVVTPLFMLLAHRFAPRYVKPIFAAAALLSLVTAVAMSLRNTTFTFYLTPFRAWELAIGAFVSMNIVASPASVWARQACGVVGAALLLGLMVFGSASAPLLAMTFAACIGTALIIASSERGLSHVGRLLSLRPIVFIGLISYSLYLWHWPIIVFQKTDNLLFDGAFADSRLVLIAVTFAAAVLSWKFVELPFRATRKDVPTRSVVLRASGAATAMLALCGAVLVFNGAPFRFPERVVAVGSYLAYDASNSFRTGHCFLGTNRQQLDIDMCMTRDPARPNYLLVGDSHAAHLWLGLSQAMPDVKIMQATASACRPAIMSVSAIETRACPKLMNFVFNRFLTENKIDKIILAAAWKPEDVPDLAETLKGLKSRGFEVTVLGPIVEYDRPLPRLLATEILRNAPQIASTMRTPGVKELDLSMRRMVTEEGGVYVSVYDSICRSGVCDEYVKGHIPMQFDAGHLTQQGSLEVGRRLASYFGGKVAKVDDVSRN